MQRTERHNSTRQQAHKWSEDELVLLRQLRQAGETATRIAEILHVTPDMVYSKCKQLLRTRKLSSRKPRPWAPDEIALFDDVALGDGEIAAKLHRSVAAVATRRKKAGVYRRAPKPWDLSTDQELISLREGGSSFAQIAGALGRTQIAVSNRVHNLIRAGKLEPLTRSERSRRAGIATAQSRTDRWSDEERLKLVSLWRSGCSVREIEALGDRSKRAIDAELAKLRRSGAIENLSGDEAQRRNLRGRATRSERMRREALTAVNCLPNLRDAGYVIGVLYGDGFVSISGNRASIGLKSTNASFCDSFANALEATFGQGTRRLSRIEPIKRIGQHIYKNVTYFECFLHSLYLAKAIRATFGNTGEKQWCADPAHCMRIGDKFTDGVIQGFFDAEGSFMQRRRGGFYATACSMNGRGLNSIRALLELRGYRPTILCDKRGQWRVSLHTQADVIRFASEIGSEIDYKKAAMQACLAKVAGFRLGGSLL